MLAQIQIFIEIALSALLLLGIAFNFHISRTLSSLKSDRANLLKLIEKLETSIKNAHDGVEKLRVAGQVSGRPLTRTIEQAKIVGSELDTLVDRADSKAEKLTDLTTKASSRELALGKLLDDAADLKLDLLRKIESPLIHEPEKAKEAEAVSKPAASTPSTDQPATSGRRTPQQETKSFRGPKQRFENTFLGDPSR
ncbi:DUF6468 domain-containing protein [Asaia sp. BMEF1]|uniref:DUF6468 domain-containing protein n=1 Tax=Asaia sp. BMEF1 TaxID=3155932 RepID=UPI003F68207A